MPVATQAWRCTVCGYVHRGAEPPLQCPVCGAPRELFEPWNEPASEEHPTLSQGERGATAAALRVVIVGAGIAGVAAAESLRSAAPEAEITLVSKEAELPYYRLNLTRYLAGQLDPRALPIHPASWYQARRIRVLLGTEAAALDLQGHVVELQGGEKLPFDKLLLAAGAQPFIPPLAGTELAGVTTLRTVEDARAILAAARAGTRCVCIGGGLLGLETAAALARHGANVTLLESHDWLLPRQTNRRAGEILNRYVATAGITLRTKAATQAIVGDRRAEGVLLQQGERIPADLVVIATGIRSNSQLAAQAGLAVNRGVVVNDLLTASHPDVFAAGDVAEHRGQVYGIWGPAQYQGNIAGLNMAGRGVEFGGLPPSNTLKVLGLDLFSIGPIEAEAGWQVIDEEGDERYFRFVFRDSRLVGAILLGDARLTAVVQKAVEGQREYSALLAHGPTAAQVAEALGKKAGA
ncbi:MAG: FAD-dependent oxidoreductase [Thermoguttaceae bacterium]